MAEQTCAAFFNLPPGRIRPKVGEFAVAKTRANAYDRVVARDVIAADDTDERSGQLWPQAAARFTGNEQITGLRYEVEQALQFLTLKMVKE